MTQINGQRRTAVLHDLDGDEQFGQVLAPHPFWQCCDHEASWYGPCQNSPCSVRIDSGVRFGHAVLDATLERRGWSKMPRDAIARMFDSELDAFAQLAAGLRPDQWEQPSLCDSWTVREVISHVAFHTHRAGPRQLLGNSEKWHARLGAEAHADTNDGLVAWLGSRAADSARRSRINLCELVIHQQDVRRPLQAPREYPETTMRSVLDHCTTATGNLLVIGVLHRHGRDLRLVATDVDWSSGTGPQVHGTAEALLMAIAGRRAALSELSGPGLSTLDQRVSAAEHKASAKG